ncbi:MAG: hypothetical protein P8X39_01600 [Desulfofustis sp.]|jgi:hypothetical protein
MKNHVMTIFLSAFLVCQIAASGGAASELNEATLLFSSNVKGELEACG